MNATHGEERLEGWLREWQLRLQRVIRLQTAAALAVTALLLTLASVLLALRHGYGAFWFGAGRLALVLAFAALLWWGLRWRVRSLQRNLAGEVEARVPELAGRAQAWVEAQQQRNPLRALLAEDTLSIAAAHPVAQRLPAWRLGVPAALAAMALAVLLWLALAGPGLWSAGVRQLWLGWAIKGLLPEQVLQVMPGDTVVRRGGNLKVRAMAQGFAPGAVQLFARNGGGDWQQVDMSAQQGGFGFTFLSLREGLQYYVRSGAVRSPTYRVQIVDVPAIQKLRLVYHYPAWTRRADETHEPGGDVSAIAGTQVALQVQTDTPLQGGVLVLDGASSALNTSGNSGSGAFDVQHDGRYYVGARVGGELVRLSDDYLITAVPDAPPQVRVLQPARDTNASRIEEVGPTIEASDDFSVQSLQLRYAVNGGAWQSIDLPAGRGAVQAQALLQLEDMKADAGRALEPGDLIAYYAVAKDHAQSAQTDMYFIDVRPFDRTYEQSQAAGGGGAGGAGGDQGEQISQRQKQIIVSTWNLLRQQRSGTTSGAQLGDNARILAQLQRSLAAQTRSLTGRSDSLTLSDDSAEIQSFIKTMNAAAAAMEPAATRLSKTELEAAIAPEQQALQQLLRAEATFRDVQVAMQQGGGAGGTGGQSGRDLSQLYELEMDLKKNQYETGSQATPGAASQQDEELQRRLQELARRQEQLASQMRQQPNAPEQRWQQEALQREAQQLQQQLQQLQQQSAAQNAGGQAGNQTAGRGATGSSAGAASSALENAIRSMSAANSALGGSAGSDTARDAVRAAQAAGRQLRGSGEQLGEQRRAQLQRSLGDLAQRAEDLYRRQAASDTELQQALERAGDSDAGLTSGGLSSEQRQRLAAEKRQLAGGLDSLQSDLAGTTQQLRNVDPAGAQSLQQARQALGDSEVGTRLAIAAQYIERGRAGFIASSESVVTDELRSLRDRLQRVAAAPAGGAATPQPDAVGQALARVQQLRQQLQQLADAGRSGGNQAATASTQQGANDQGGTGQGGSTGEVPAGLAGELRGVGRAAGSLMAGTVATGAEQNQVRALAEQLRGAQLGGAQLEAQLRRNLQLLEQLEMQLRRQGGAGVLRSAPAEPGTQEYQAAVAEYYRQLSR